MSAAEERLANDPTSELWGEHRSRYRFAAQFISTGERVVDVACGAGFGLRMLQETGAAVIGIDYDAQTLRALGNSTVARADATRLPIATGSVDHVVSFETIEHVADAGALVREIRRVLKPDGKLILSTPNRAFGPPERHTGNPFHIREFTARELREILCAHFATVRMFGQRPSPSYRFVPYLLHGRTFAPDALAWKLMLRLPYSARNTLAYALHGKSFYPGEGDYCFQPDATDGAHALVAVAQ